MFFAVSTVVLSRGRYKTIAQFSHEFIIKIYQISAIRLQICPPGLKKALTVDFPGSLSVKILSLPCRTSRFNP